MRTHGYHWFDKARMAHDPQPSPVRREALLYNIFNTRTEGHATGWEELMMQAGMFDARPRSRELVYVLVAERAARALGELFMQANLMTLEQAAAFACANTPRGWLRMDGNLVRDEQHLYLQQPGYGPSYLVGKIEIEKLLAERRQAARRRLPHEGVHGRVQRRRPRPGFAPALGADRETVGRAQENARVTAAANPGAYPDTRALSRERVRIAPFPLSSVGPRSGPLRIRASRAGRPGSAEGTGTG